MEGNTISLEENVPGGGGSMMTDQKKFTMLIVDDEIINREILKDLFEEYYEIETAADGREAVNKILEAPERYSAVLLDVIMPEMDGLEVLRRLRAKDLLSQVPVFLITAENTTERIREAYELGAMDVIGKPVVPYIVHRRVESVIELFEARKRLRSQVSWQKEKLLESALRIKELNQGMIEAMATAIEFRDVESGDHVQRIRNITECMLLNTKLGEGMSRQDIENIALASVMHDVGKIAIPDAILNKPGRLTAEEFEIMKNHAALGEQLLGSIPVLRQSRIYKYACDIARHHHERWDGRGYPDGLKGNEISIWTQIVSIADVYDALSCKRVYKDAFTRERVLEMIRDGECGAFSPQLLEAFFSVEEEISRMYESETLSL
ncbi:HD-GYP domain-containing protein [Frisingicoccus sp.]|uniref:HD-GYP domain-containing protein n=1 Tax=Frisingicoccus sp. TaxID=1918627 RepID=UPI002E75A2A9|nr:HD domain-containing phosphohydrolase [Frisingicoccus sp.]MEE0751345.1 response regulator [Frisingicoccus sp.]